MVATKRNLRTSNYRDPDGSNLSENSGGNCPENRFDKLIHDVSDHGIYDSKGEKSMAQSAGLFLKIGVGSAVFIMVLHFQTSWIQIYHDHQFVIGGDETPKLNGGGGFDSRQKIIGLENHDRKDQGYELFPFLVDAEKVASSLSSSTAELNSVLSTPTMPDFPLVPRLERCLLKWKPPHPPRSQEDKRLMFWMPSYPSSGGSCPTKKGDIVRQVIDGLFLGERIDATAYGNPTKDFHASSNNLKRCIGVSETIACTSSHPLVSTTPHLRHHVFRGAVIVPIRNPATVIPQHYTSKDMAYRQASGQISVESWRQMRDSYFEGSLADWMRIIRFWRGTKSRLGEPASYYQTELYVPYEDLITTDVVKASAIIEKVSNLLGGAGSTEIVNASNATSSDLTKHGFFETSKSKADYECLWYRVAHKEWERLQNVIGHYIPAYTVRQKNMMIQNLTIYADEIEAEILNDKSDLALASLLRRYAFQIKHYVVVEDVIYTPQ
ncbi:unnamed protein product [Pseudo-nitzschia multistriata]|uniref:Sulfotransferase domain-containing protein n=1 Tax=Pseudo-nitzschia multistriata TaxID=183589 RepID=A0A448Z9K4_9STRA|nr:unnamed protein product [Pseudo-nitzschia multistriata]